MIPRALGFAIEHGLAIRIVKTRPIRWPAAYKAATEQYSSQVYLDEYGTMRNYRVGLPFPLIDSADPTRALKIAYNWHWGPFIPEQVNLTAAQKERAWRIDPNDPDTLISDDTHADFRNEGSCQQIVVRRYAHVLRDGAASRDSPVEFKQRGDYCGPEPNAYIMIQYLDPGRASDSWYFPEAVRRWRRTKLQGGYPHQSCTYACAQFWWEYLPPKTESYSYRLVREQPLLGCMDANAAGAGIVPSRGGARFGSIDCEVRSAWVIEMLPHAAPEKVIRSVLYVDKETYLFLGADFYREDTSPESLVPLWSRNVEGAGAPAIVLADDYYVPSDRPGFFLSLNLGEERGMLDTDEPPANLFNPRVEGYRLR